MRRRARVVVPPMAGLGWREVGHQQQQMPNRDYLTAQGNAVTEADVALAMGNWGSIVAVTGQTVTIPTAQVGPAATIVAALAMMPLTSGIFACMARMSYSDGATAGAPTATLFTKQGATTGQVTGGVAAAKFGALVPGAGAGGGTYVGANGQILNVNAAGGNGLLFEGAAASTIAQHSDAQASLTGLLTANGIGVNSFGYFGVLDAVGGTSLTKTPFTIGKPMVIALGISDAGHTVTFDSLSIFVMELPVG